MAYTIVGADSLVGNALFIVKKREHLKGNRTERQKNNNSRNLNEYELYEQT